MENYDNLIDPIEVTPNMSESWRKMGNWAYFFSVLGIIAIFILILCFAAYNFAVFELLRNAAAPGRIAPYQEERISTLRWTLFFSDLIFLLSIGFFFMIQRAHFLFANGVAPAVRSLQQSKFESVWQHLRNHFRLYGIFVITMLFVFFALLMWSTLYIKAPDYY
jgi:hypothetical protein